MGQGFTEKELLVVRIAKIKPGRVVRVVVEGIKKNRRERRRRRRFDGEGNPRVQVRRNGSRYVNPRDLIMSPKFGRSLERAKKVTLGPDKGKSG